MDLNKEDFETFKSSVMDFFNFELHKLFLKKHLNTLNAAYSDLDGIRNLPLFFSVSGLDLLSTGEEMLFNDETRKRVIDWVYSLQIIPEKPEGIGGFRGSTNIGNIFNPENGSKSSCELDIGHITSTLTSILILLIMRDDLSRVNRYAILSFVQSLQVEDGSFCSLSIGGECDMRFCYCATAIVYLLDEWEFINTTNLVKFILSSQNVDGGFGQLKSCESHGGSSYCAIASLVLIKESKPHVFKELDVNIDEIIEKGCGWCARRQTDCGGFQGRPMKDPDTCYSFWNMAPLSMNNFQHFTSFISHTKFLLTTQNPKYGGFSKFPDLSPDILHTFFGICGLCILGIGPSELNCPLMISKKTFEYWKELRFKFNRLCF